MDAFPNLALLLIATFLGANIAAFAAFHTDKRLAQEGKRRIREDTLLMLAFFGGTPGAYAARHVFRHKTRKQPFSDQLFSILVLQVMVVAGAVVWLA